jgi:hypothetical protein
MSEPIVVNAPFSNISQLAHGFVERISADSIVLPSATPVPPGQWTQFTVLLNDGTVAFTGIGRSARSADRGPQAPPRSRFDILLDSLRFEESSMRIFEQLVAASQSGFQSEPRPSDGPVGPEWRTADVTDDEVEQIPSDSAPVIRGADAAPISAPPVTVQEKPNPNEQNPFPGSILQRPVRMTSWQPEPRNTSTPPTTTGLFKYPEGSLPKPDRAPRPDLAPEMRVMPAPKPPIADRPTAPATPRRAFVAENSAVAATDTPDAMNSRPAPMDAQESAHESAVTPEQTEQAVMHEPTTKQSPVSPDLLSEDVAITVDSDPPPPNAAFPAERVTAKIQAEKLADLLESERPSKGHRRRGSKRPPKR